MSLSVGYSYILTIYLSYRLDPHTSNLLYLTLYQIYTTHHLGTSLYHLQITRIDHLLYLLNHHIQYITYTTYSIPYLYYTIYTIVIHTIVQSTYTVISTLVVIQMIITDTYYDVALISVMCIRLYTAILQYTPIWYSL